MENLGTREFKEIPVQLVSKVTKVEAEVWLVYQDLRDQWGQRVSQVYQVGTENLGQKDSKDQEVHQGLMVSLGSQEILGSQSRATGEKMVCRDLMVCLVPLA